MDNTTFFVGQLVPSAKFDQKNRELIAKLRGEDFSIVGSEITDASLAKELDINVDPQHSGKKEAISALKYLVDGRVQLPATDKVALLYYRPDPDSLGCLGAVMEYYQSGSFDAIDAEKVAEVDLVDNSATTEWKPDAVSDEVVVSVSDYASISEYYRDRNASPEQKVLTTLAWLKGEDVSATLKKAAAGALKNKQMLREALIDGSGILEVLPSGVATFQGPGVGGSSFAYKFAPLGILFDREGLRNSGQPKWTVCQFSAGYADFSAITEELNALETAEGTWGGQGNTCGSPQNTTSSLELEQIVEVVERHLSDKFRSAVKANAEAVAKNLAYLAELQNG
jgi:hypothetical protein